MADTLVLLLVVAFFAASASVIAACDRIASGPDHAATDLEARDAR